MPATEIHHTGYVREDDAIVTKTMSSPPPLRRRPTRDTGPRWLSLIVTADLALVAICAYLWPRWTLVGLLVCVGLVVTVLVGESYADDLDTRRNVAPATRPEGPSLPFAPPGDCRGQPRQN